MYSSSCLVFSGGPWLTLAICIGFVEAAFAYAPLFILESFCSTHSAIDARHKTTGISPLESRATIRWSALPRILAVEAHFGITPEASACFFVSAVGRVLRYRVKRCRERSGRWQCCMLRSNPVELSTVKVELTSSCAEELVYALRRRISSGEVVARNRIVIAIATIAPSSSAFQCFAYPILWRTHASKYEYLTCQGPVDLT